METTTATTANIHPQTSTAITAAQAAEILIACMAEKISVESFLHIEEEGRYRGGRRTSIGYRGTVAGLSARPHNHGQWTVAVFAGRGTVTLYRGVDPKEPSENLRGRIKWASFKAQATGGHYWVDADSLACGGA